MPHLPSKKNVLADAMLANSWCTVHCSTADEWLSLTDWSDRLEQNHIYLLQIKDSPAFISKKSMNAGIKFYWKWHTCIVNSRQMSSGVAEGKVFVFNILEIKGMEFLWVTHILKSKIEQVSLFSTKWWGHTIFQNLLRGTKSLNCSLYLGVCIMDSAIWLENHCEVLLPYHLFFFVLD